MTWRACARLPGDRGVGDRIDRRAGSWPHERELLRVEQVGRRVPRPSPHQRVDRGDPVGDFDDGGCLGHRISLAGGVGGERYGAAGREGEPMLIDVVVAW